MLNYFCEFLQVTTAFFLINVKLLEEDVLHFS